MKPEIINGDLLFQDVEVIVNSWNRNIIPWWLLLPQGVSAAIKKQAGIGPFKEIAKLGLIPLGEARLTSAGMLSYKGIIHVAGINMFWVATEYSVSQSVVNVMKIINENGYSSVAFPLIGSGSGNRGKEWSLNVMLNSFSGIESEAKVILVQYDKSS